MQRLGFFFLFFFLVLVQEVRTFSLLPQPLLPASAILARRQQLFHQAASSTRRAAAAKKSDDDNDDEGPAPGMNDAFRQLESLSSLAGNDEAKSPSSKPPPISAQNVPDDVVKQETTPLTTEKEVQMYTNMMKDLESTDENSLYKDVLQDMGFASSSGSSKKKQKSANPNRGASSSLLPQKQQDLDEFMENALSEALDEVKLKSPRNLSAESILNDKEIMKEIESIFDRGSAQLMESLEEIRKEQQMYAEASAQTSANEAADAVSQESKRLVRAEASMTVMLERVNKEAVKVEQAAQDLRDAQAEIDKNFVVKLRNGGIPKQAALVGFVLFAFRSIGDTLAALNTTDESLLTGALLQGGIAIVCAAIFFFL